MPENGVGKKHSIIIVSSDRDIRRISICHVTLYDWRRKSIEKRI
jgi:hypothetical protein